MWKNARSSFAASHFGTSHFGASHVAASRLAKAAAAIVAATGLAGIAVVDRRPMTIAGVALGALFLRGFLVRHRKRRRVTLPARLVAAT